MYSADSIPYRMVIHAIRDYLKTSVKKQRKLKAKGDRSKVACNAFEITVVLDYYRAIRGRDKQTSKHEVNFRYELFWEVLNNTLGPVETWRERAREHKLYREKRLKILKDQAHLREIQGEEKVVRGVPDFCGDTDVVTQHEGTAIKGL